MTGKWRWLIYALLIWQIFRATDAAVSTPWRWTLEQLLFVVFVGCAAILLGKWAYVWLYGGNEAVRENWAKFQRKSAAPIDKSASLRALFLWIVIAVALVAIFNISQR